MFKTPNVSVITFPYSAVGAGAGLTAAGFPVAILCGLLTPNEPLNLFPFAVFLSPLPMIN